MRKKRPEEHPSHERWLISYADFITLLFAFFVVMFAVSQVDSKRLGHFTESFARSTGVDIFPDRGTRILSGHAGTLVPIPEGEPPTPHRPATDLDSLKTALDEMVAKDDELKGLEVVRHRDDLVLRLSESIVFDSGEDVVKAPAARMLRAISPELRKRNLEVRVEGHTDNRPIKTARFRSNWELSTGRATAVIELLAYEGGIPPERLAAAGCGEFRPIASNGTEEGRRMNRRVDLMLTVLPKAGP